MAILKLLSASTALALALALASPTASFAQGRVGRAGGGGGGGHAMGVGGGRIGGPALGGGSIGRGGGASFAAPAAPSRIGGIGRTTAWNAGRGWNGGGWHHRGWWPGAAFVAGAALGGSYAYDTGPSDYDNDAYYDYPDYYYDGSVTVAPGPAGVDAGYCAQRYRSYDPATGTYLGYDGQRHPCP